MRGLKGVNCLINKLPSDESLGGSLELELSGSQISIGGWMEWEGSRATIKLIVDPESQLYADFLPKFAISVNGRYRRPREIGSLAYFRSRVGNMTLLQMGEPFLKAFTVGQPIEAKFYPRFVLFDYVHSDDVRTPSCAKAQIGGLTQWSHGSYVTRPLDLSTTADGDSPYLEVALRTRDFKPVEYCLDGVTIEISSVVVPERDKNTDALAVVFHSMVEVNFNRKGKWSDFVETMLHLQDLVNLLSWRSFAPSLLHVAFEGYESSGHPSWIRVFNSNFEGPENANIANRYRFAMPIERLSSEVLSVWLMKRAEHAHALELILQVVRAPQMSYEVQALQLGAGIEAIGYKLFSREVGEERADKKRAVALFRRVSEDARRIFPAEFKDWATNANENYQAMKHMSRARPSPGLVAEINDRSTLAIQIWIASTLGANDDEIREYVEASRRLTSTYARVPDPSELG